MKEKENGCKGRRNSVSTLLKLLFICSILLLVSMKNTTIMGEGFFLIDEVHSSLLEEGERGRVLYERDGVLYLIVANSAQTEELTDCIHIVDFQQPENPVVIGRYDLDINETLVDFKISENTAYLLRRKRYEGVGNWTLSLLDISNIINPILLGTTPLEHIPSYSLNPNYLSIHNKYAYINTDYELQIFNCSDPTVPVKVANYTSTGAELHTNNNFLYLVANGVKIYSLSDPVNPVFLGEVNSSKHTITGSELFGNYVVNVFYWFGVEIYNCTDPYHPTICWDYNYTGWEYTYYGWATNDMTIYEDRLFLVSKKFYIFDISNPQHAKRIARINLGDGTLSGVTVTKTHMFITISGNIIIYSYVENLFARNLGIGIGAGLSIVVGVSILIRRKKKKR